MSSGLSSALSCTALGGNENIILSYSADESTRCCHLCLARQYVLLCYCRAECVHAQDSSGTAAEAKPATSAIARELILEVGDLVADHYLDAREGGFNKDKWRGMIREALQKSLPDANAAYRYVQSSVSLPLPSSPAH